MSDLSALIVALEGATGPSRELDIEIARAMGDQDVLRIYADPEITVRTANAVGLHWECPGCVGNVFVERYTSSIDAALTLVPPDMFVGMRRFSDGWYATVAVKSDLEDKSVWRGNQKPAAIALCIAALKARQASSTPSDQSPVPQNTGHDR